LRELASSSGGNVKSLRPIESCQQKGTGQTMTTQARNCARAEKLQDFLMLSSFGFWTILLGFAPVVTYHSLMS
jgi:hypothetical protein